MSRSDDDGEQAEMARAEQDGWSILDKGWFRALLWGLAILMVAFIALPYLLDNKSPAPTRSPAVALPSGLQTSESANPPAVLPSTHRAEKAAPASPATNSVAEAPHREVKSPASAAPRSREPRISKAAAAPMRPTGQFWVQVGAFQGSDSATRLAARIRREHYRVEVHRRASTASPWVVWVGSYPDRQRAEAARVELERRGFSGLILRDQKG